MYVCLCHAVSERRVREVVDQGARSFEEVQACTGVSTCCGCCESTARAVIEDQLSAETQPLHIA